MRKPKIGLALGGGAARGWSHIGVIKALTEAGIEPDFIAGTSIGALVGGVYSSGKLETLESWAIEADWRIVMSMIDVSFWSGGLVDGARILEWLNSLGGSEKIEDLQIPFAAVATDLTSGREVWLQKGDLGRAVRASIALPGIFSPVEVEDNWLVDGGLVNPVPVSLCRAMGAEMIIAVPLNADVLGQPLVARNDTPETKDKPSDAKEQGSGSFFDQIKNLPKAIGDHTSGIKLFGESPVTPGYFDVLANSINIMQDQITRARLAGEPPHVQINPRVTKIGLMDFHRAEVAIEAGYQAAKEAIPTIQSKL